MQFDSAFFLFCFLPVLVVLHLILRPRRVRNGLLLLAGLVFYAFSGLSALAVLAALTLVTYGFGLLLMSLRHKKPVLAAALVVQLGLLAGYKYLDFFLGSLLPVFHGSWTGLGLAVPAGLSFFTFKCVSYVIDVYRQPPAGTKNPLKLLLYVSFFPQLLAGPITRFRDFAEQLEDRQPQLEDLTLGLRRFILGLGKKVFLAAAAGAVADPIFALDRGGLNAPLAWLGAACYTLQIFFDFSGYSDMAIGLGRMFGFHTPENFNYPYVVDTISQFWRRWHISLSGWFRDYVYIPLGGNRKGRYRTALNKLIVFALCGLWHGAAWTFVLWGLWHGLWSGLESLGSNTLDRLRRHPVGRGLMRVYTLLVVLLGFVLFRADTITGGLTLLGAMIGLGGGRGALITLHTVLTLPRVLLLLSAVVLCTPVIPRLSRGRENSAGWQTLCYGGCFVLLVLCIAQIAAGEFTPFIYFQF